MGFKLQAQPESRSAVTRGSLPPAVTEAAAQLGVTRPALSRILNGRAAISPEMALRLEGWLGVKNGGRADLWLAQQCAYDLWKARKAGAPRVRKAKMGHDATAS